ncbi:MAG TPA: helix-turn-helix domain-containing protein, partial [Methylomirabilota bacterium]|nr:helix-turn-helix domain-containing protein [Methylomirabilota bacterium]
EAPTDLILRLRRDLARMIGDCDFVVSKRALAAQALPAGSPTGEEDRYVTIPRVAERTGLSVSYLYELARRGILPVRAMGRREGGKRPRGYRILLSDLRAWEADLVANPVDQRVGRVLGSAPKHRERRM